MKAPRQNTLRIIGGAHRGRRLAFPPDPALRPSPDRVRETLFNWLQSHIPGEDCLDLFAGSGACGIEALSRDACHVTFIDSSAPALAAIRSNLTMLGAQNFSLHQQDALRWLQAPGAGQYGVVFVDPPFAAGVLEAACQSLEDSGVLKQAALIYLETGAGGGQPRVPANWVVLKSRQAGAVHFFLCQREATDVEDRQA